MTLQQTGQKTIAGSKKHGDTTSAILILVIASLVLAILIFCTPEAAQLTPEQINELPLWGP